jgi:hypothetical protein
MIATALGGPWLGYAQAAALEINEIKADDSTSIQLLSDIRGIIEDTDKIFSKALIEELVSLEDRPWATYNRGKPISYRQVSKILNAFDIKTNRTIRLGDTTAKGFETSWFRDIFARYLSPEGDSDQSHRSRSCNFTNLDEIFNRSQPNGVTDTKSDLTPCKDLLVTDVTDENLDGAWEDVD